MAQTLPAKEANLFKRVLRSYEQKQYRMGLKFCDRILSVFPNHGETTSLKGLMLNSMDRKEEAINMAKLGLRQNIKSHVCWHVLGLIYKAEKDYDQAIKSYKSALRIDPNNMQILRDMSTLQIQVRDFEGFTETRFTMLQQRAEQAGNWMGFAVGSHLDNNHDKAIEVIDQYLDLHKDDGDAIETSELLMYKAQVLREKGNPQVVLTFLDGVVDKIKDGLAYKELRAELYQELEAATADAAQRAEHRRNANRIYQQLVHQNPENREYYCGLEATFEPPLDTEEKRTRLYQWLQKKYPRARMPSLIPLLFSTGDRFTTLLAEYLQDNIRKGVVQTFQLLRELYQNTVTPDPRVAVVEELAEKYVNNLEAVRKFEDVADEPEEYPTVLLWAYFFAAQHFDKMGKYAQAMQLIDKAIAHTPTLLELYMAKGKIYKHCGNYEQAAHWLNYARDMDTADRFINCKCAKYMLRAGQVAQAEQTASFFTKEHANPVDHLTELQCMWFETEVAKSCLAQNAMPKALSRLHAIQEHFATFVDDQMDFHGYSLRKMTLRAYVRLLRLEDRIHDHKFFVEASLMAIKAYVQLSQQAWDAKKPGEEDPRFAGMTAEEKKKAMRKIRKAELRAQEAQELAKKDKPKEQKGKMFLPDGDELIKTDKPLDVAITKFLLPLQRLTIGDIRVHLAAFDVYLQRKKVLLMLQSLLRAHRLDARHPDLHRALVAFIRFVKDRAPSDQPAVEQALAAGIKELLGEGVAVDAASFNEAFLKREQGTSVAHAFAGLELSIALGGDAAGAVAQIVALAQRLTHLDLALAQKMHLFLLGADRDSAAKFAAVCAAHFPFSAVFMAN